jgi:hypothetical protein
MAPSYLEVGASGKPGTVQFPFKERFSYLLSPVKEFILGDFDWDI